MAVLVRNSIAVMKHHEKQVGDERVYLAYTSHGLHYIHYMAYTIVHYWRKSGQELK